MIRDGLGPTAKATKGSLRTSNEQLVLRCIAAGVGDVSRADVARMTGLTRATVSEIVAALMERGLVRESGQRRAVGSGGKPATLLELDRDSQVVLAAEIRPDRIVCGAVLLSGAVDEIVEFAHDGSDSGAVTAMALRTMRAGYRQQVLAVGVAVPGIVRDGGVVLDSVPLHWREVPLAQRLAEQLQAHVYLLNDATASAVFESTVGSQDRLSLVALHIGAGVGAGMVLQGRLYEGPAHRAGEIGHLRLAPSDQPCACGRIGCLETVVSLPALLAGLGDGVLTRRAVGSADADVVVLDQRVEDAAVHLAALVEMLMAVADVGDVVIGGPVGVVGNDLLHAVRRRLDIRQMPGFEMPVVRFSTFGEDSVLLGAATHAFRQRLGVGWGAPGPDGVPVTGRDLSLVETHYGGYSMARLSVTRRFFSAAVASTILLAGAAACGDDAADGKLQLEVWTHEFEPLQEVLKTKWIPEFEKANPDIKVRLTSIPFAGVVSYDSKLLSALSSGGGPDVWDMGDWNYRTFAENKFLEPIDPKAFGYASDSELIDSFLPGTTGAMEKDGKLLGMFSEFNTLNLFYNEEVFADAGIAALPKDKPVSWEEIGRIGEKLRVEEGGAVQRIGYQFGFFANFRSPQWYAQNYYMFLRQFGQDDVYIDGKPAADTAAAVSAFQLIYDFTHTFRAYDPNFLNNWFADVPQGRAGMVLAGTWYPAAAKANNKNFKFSVVPSPVVDPADKSTYKNVSWLWGWSVNANSPDPKKEAAQRFLAFILGKKGETAQAADWFERLGYMQPSNAFLDSEAYKKALADNPWLNLWIDALKNYEVKPVPHSYDEAGAALVRAIDRIVYDKTSASDAAAQLQTELTRLS